MSIVSACFPPRRSRIHDLARATARMRAWFSRRGGESRPPGTMISFRRSRQRLYMDLPRVAVFVGGVAGRGCCGWPPGDLNLAGLNDHPLDGVAHQCARLGTPPSRRAVGQELGSGQLPAQDRDHQPLDIVGIDAGERAASGRRSCSSVHSRIRMVPARGSGVACARGRLCLCVAKPSRKFSVRAVGICTTSNSLLILNSSRVTDAITASFDP